MKKLTFLLIILLFSLNRDLQAQKDFFIRNQNDYTYNALPILDSLGIEKPDFNKINLQIQFSIFNYETGIHKLFFIERLKGGNWRGKSIEYYDYNKDHYNFKDVLQDTFALGASWNEAFKKLVEKSYVNIPSQIEVKKSIAKSNKGAKNKESLIVADGTNYQLAFITKNKKRRISFSNPEAYYEHYKSQGYNLSFFEKYLDLLDILKGSLDFETHLKRKE